MYCFSFFLHYHRLICFILLVDMYMHVCVFMQSKLDALLQSNISIYLDQNGVNDDNIFLQELAFDVIYHGQNEKPLRQKLAALEAKLSPNREKTWQAFRSGQGSQFKFRAPRAKEIETFSLSRVRVGFVSLNFSPSHSVGRSLIGIISHLNPELFEVTIFHFLSSNLKVNDTGLLYRADKLILLPFDVDGARKLIFNRLIDILVFPDIGADKLVSDLGMYILFSLLY